MSERPPAGWFPDPSGRSEQRYWDGDRWTNRVRNPSATDASPAGSPPTGPSPTGPSPTGPSPAGEPSGTAPSGRPSGDAASVAPTGTSTRQTRAGIQRSRRHRPRWLWVLGAVALVAVLGVGGYALFSGGDSGTNRSTASSTSTTGGPSTTSTTGPSTTSTTGTTGSTTVSTTPPTTVPTLPEPDAAASAISKAQFDAVALGTSQADVIKQLGKPPANPQKFVSSKVLKQSDIEATCLYYTEAGNGFQSGFRFCFPASKLKTKKAF